MLKITIIDTPAEQKLVLEGRLTEPDIPELESAWEKARGERGTRRCIVDLLDATFIDESAERILLKIQSEGARFIACGVFNKHWLKRLGIHCKASFRKTPA